MKIEFKKVAIFYYANKKLMANFIKNQNDLEKLLPWNIEITPYKIRGE